MIGRIQNPTETTLKCQWVIEESAHDGNVSTGNLPAIMRDDWNPHICRLNENILNLTEVQSGSR